MTKIFYFALLISMSYGLIYGVTVFQVYQGGASQKSFPLLQFGYYLQILAVVSLFILAGFFFLYTRYEKVLVPILATVFSLVAVTGYFGTLSSLTTQPVRYFERRLKQLNRTQPDFGQRVIQCTGLEECAVKASEKYFPKLHNLCFEVVLVFFIHIACIIGFWFTHLTGGIQDDESPRPRDNVPLSSLRQAEM